MVWGVVIYQFFSYQKEFEIKKELSFEKAPQSPRAIEADTFSVSANYRDPFFGSYEKKPRPVSRVKKPVDIKAIDQTSTVSWPEVKCFGIIKSKRKEKYLIQINGKNYLLAPKEEAEGIVLVRGNASQIVIRYKGKTKNYPSMISLGSATLPFTLYIVLVMTLLSLGLIQLNEYSLKTADHSQIRSQLLDNSLSGIYYAMALPTSNRMDTLKVNLFENKKNNVTVYKKLWGIYTVVRSEAFFKHQTISRIGFIGRLRNSSKDSCLILI